MKSDALVLPLFTLQDTDSLNYDLMYEFLSTKHVMIIIYLEIQQILKKLATKEGFGVILINFKYY